MAGRLPELSGIKFKYEKSLGHRMIKQFLNLLVARYLDLSATLEHLFSSTIG